MEMIIRRLLSKIIRRSRGSMDRVSDYGSEGWGFKSLRGCSFYIFNINNECDIYIVYYFYIIYISLTSEVLIITNFSKV